MFSWTGYCYAIQDFKKIKVQHFKQIFSCTSRRFPLTPSIKSSLGVPKYFINGAISIELFVYVICVSFICKGKLIFQVIKAIVYRRSRKHKNFGFYTCSNNFFHQGNIAIILCFFIRIFNYLTTVSEIMRFINNYKTVVTPIYSVKVKTIWLSMCSVKVCMIKNIITEAVGRNRVVNVIIFICVPVVG